MKRRECPTEPPWATARTLLAATFLSVGVNLHAATFVSGIVAGETWTASASPYVVTGDLAVVGVGLAIQPDVVVEFAGPYEFRVLGRLQVSGDAQAPVLFTRQNAATGWKGIVFDQADPDSFFNGAIIEGATNSGVRITNAPPAFTNCIVRNNTAPGDGGGILAALSGSPLVMHGCVITNNVAGPTSLWGGGGGLCAYGPSVLVGCMFVGNRVVGLGQGGGLWSEDCTMRGCSVVSNSGGDASNQTSDGIFIAGGAHWTWLTALSLQIGVRATPLELYGATAD